MPSSAVNLIDAGTRGTNMQPPSGLEATSPSESDVPLLRFASDMILWGKSIRIQKPPET